MDLYFLFKLGQNITRRNIFEIVNSQDSLTPIEAVSALKFWQDYPKYFRAKMRFEELTRKFSNVKMIVGKPPQYIELNYDTDRPTYSVIGPDREPEVQFRGKIKSDIAFKTGLKLIRHTDPQYPELKGDEFLGRIYPGNELTNRIGLAELHENCQQRICAEMVRRNISTSAFLKSGNLCRTLQKQLDKSLLHCSQIWPQDFTSFPFQRRDEWDVWSKIISDGNVAISEFVAILESQLRRASVTDITIETQNNLTPINGAHGVGVNHGTILKSVGGSAAGNHGVGVNHGTVETAISGSIDGAHGVGINKGTVDSSIGDGLDKHCELFDECAAAWERSGRSQETIPPTLEKIADFVSHEGEFNFSILASLNSWLLNNSLVTEGKPAPETDVRANEPKFIYATNHAKPDLQDLAVAVNRALADPKNNKSENQIAHGFFNAETDEQRKEAEAKLQAIRIYERRKRKAS